MQRKRKAKNSTAQYGKGEAKNSTVMAWRGVELFSIEKQRQSTELLRSSTAWIGQANYRQITGKLI